MWHVREAVLYRGLFTAGWFGVREKHGSRLKIYDRLRASEQAVYRFKPYVLICVDRWCIAMGRRLHHRYIVLGFSL